VITNPGIDPALTEVDARSHPFELLFGGLKLPSQPQPLRYAAAICRVGLREMPDRRSWIASGTPRIAAAILSKSCR